MEILIQGTLKEIIENINDIDDESILYLEKDSEWTVDSKGAVLQFDLDEEPGGLKVDDLTYFLEVYLVKEAIEAWKDEHPDETGIEDLCDAAIYYAEYDSYKA